MTLTEKIVALGTEQGRVRLLDYSGTQVKLLNLHKSRVNDLCFDKETEHLASASQDCSVVVTDLYTYQGNRHEFRAPVKLVALDPRPPASSRRTWRDLVTGTAAGEVTLHTQGWLARSDQPLAAASSRDAAAGGVLALKWSGPLVAWAFDSVVSVYDTISHQLIRTLRRYDPRTDSIAVGPLSTVAGAATTGASGAKGPAPSPASAPAAAASASPGKLASATAAAGPAPAAGLASLHRCSLLFAPDSHLYVAWSDTILVARIGSYENNVGWLAPQVELVARMRLDEAVLGVSPYGDDDLAVLVYPSAAPSSPQQQQQRQHKPQRQQLPAAAEALPAAAPPNNSEAGLSAAKTPAGAVADAATSAEAAAAATSAAAVADGAVAAASPTSDDGGTAEGGAAALGADAEPPAPPDPLAPGRTPQLVILGRADHREWARDSVPLPAAERCGPADYLGLLPSLPHHLHLPTVAAVAATAAAGVAPKPAAPPPATTVTATTSSATKAAARPLTPAAAAPAPSAAEAASNAQAASAKGAGAAKSHDGSAAGKDRKEEGGGAGADGPAAAAAPGAAGVPAGPGVAASGTAAGRSAAAPTTDAAAAGAGTKAAADGPPAAPAPARRLVPVWVDGQELMFFIAAPMAIATARSRDASDRLSWLLVRRRWEEALTVAEEAPPGSLPAGTYDKVVDGYIEELLTLQAYDRAAELSERLLRGDAKRWERLVLLYAQLNQLPKLVGRLPTDQPKLSMQVYDLALRSLLPNPSDHPALVALAQRWPAAHYSMAALADAVAERLRRLQAEQQQHEAVRQRPGQQGAGRQRGWQGQKGQQKASSPAQSPQGERPEEDGRVLWQLLAWLYEQQGRPDLALSIHLRLRSPAVFAFVTQHGQQANLLGRAPDLLQVDERAALALLTTHADALPPTNVVPSIQEAMRTASTPAEAEVWRRRLFAYLQGLFAVDSSVGADYQDLQVSLTAEYQPSKLMDLLVSSQYYSLEAALAICEARGLVPEQVFVLGRMGNADQALRLIIDRLGDIPRAIDFVVGQRDEELWGRLIDWALHSPETTGALLDCIGGYVDPLLLVRRIPRGMRVERLRDRLRAIIADYRTQTSLREGCNAILRSDCRHLLAKLYDGTRRALPFVYVHRQGTGGEPGQWCRCDVVHGGRLQSVTPSEVPWEVTSNHHLGLGLEPGSMTAPDTATPTSLNRGRHHDYQGAGNLAPQPAAGSGGLTRTHGSSAPALDGTGFSGGPEAGARPAQQPYRNLHALGQGSSAAKGRDRDKAAEVAAGASSAADMLPWWALQDGGDGHQNPHQHQQHHHEPAGASLWVGFNLAAGRARLGGEDGAPEARRSVVGAEGTSRAAAPAAGLGTGGRRGPGQAGATGGGGGGGRGATLGSLWQHVVTQA